MVQVQESLGGSWPDMEGGDPVTEAPSSPIGRWLRCTKGIQG